MSCACFGLCVPLPFMPSYVWAKWRQPITTNLSYQLITSLSLLMLLTMLFPLRSHSCTTSTATTSPLFRWSCNVSLLSAPFNLSSIIPVHRQYFCGLLTTAIKRCGLNPARYKGHSFRIGAASHATERGMSDAQIRVLGRWKSNAFCWATYGFHPYPLPTSLILSDLWDWLARAAVTTLSGFSYPFRIVITLNDFYFRVFLFGTDWQGQQFSYRL